jgi:predicted AlkP superfamily pyrophosphatase or phosphodiesterase
MRALLPAAVAFFLTFSAISGAAHQPQQQPARPSTPKLVVIVVVDQLWAGYLDEFKTQWKYGFRRLMDHGAWFRNAAYPYLNTVTCVGHATISTGAFPDVHGMILNGWWDRDLKKTVTCTEDPASPIYSYGAPVTGGESPKRLLAPTFSDELRAHDGAGTRVVTMSMKARSAIDLAGHEGTAVTWLADNGSWVTSAAYPAPVQFVKDFVTANPVDKDFGASWTKLLRDSDYAYKDDGEGERPPKGWTSTFPHLLKGASDKPDITFHSQWETSPFADAYLGRFADAALDALKLGHGSATDFLGVSFAAADTVGHDFGPRSQEIQDVLLRLDRTLGALFEHLDRSVGADRYVAALTADHGVAVIPEQLIREGRDAGRIDTAVVTARVEQAARTALGDAPPGKYVANVVYTDIYFETGVYSRLVAKPGALKNVIDAISGVPGIRRVFRGDELRSAQSSKDPLERAAALSYFPGRSGDLILVPKPNWILGTSAATTHGTANEYDQRVPVILFGAGVKAGIYPQAATPADVAPTLAAICGVSMPKAQGRVLREALTPAFSTTHSQAAR